MHLTQTEIEQAINAVPAEVVELAITSLQAGQAFQMDRYSKMGNKTYGATNLKSHKAAATASQPLQDACKAQGIDIQVAYWAAKRQMRDSKVGVAK